MILKREYLKTRQLWEISVVKMQSSVVRGCSVWKLNALILFYFYHQHWIGAGSRRSQCDEGFCGGLAQEKMMGAIHMSCCYSNCWPGGLEFLTTVFLVSWNKPAVGCCVALKLCTSASEECVCTGTATVCEALLCGDTSRLLCCSV